MVLPIMCIVIVVSNTSWVSVKICKLKLNIPWHNRCLWLNYVSICSIKYDTKLTYLTTANTPCTIMDMTLFFTIYLYQVWSWFTPQTYLHQTNLSKDQRCRKCIDDDTGNNPFNADPQTKKTKMFWETIQLRNLSAWITDVTSQLELHHKFMIDWYSSITDRREPLGILKINITPLNSLGGDSYTKSATHLVLTLDCNYAHKVIE